MRHFSSLSPLPRSYFQPKRLEKELLWQALRGRFAVLCNPVHPNLSRLNRDVISDG